MRIEVRIYTTYDMDLAILCHAGYPVANMMKMAVEGYANGKPVTFEVDEEIPYALDNKKTIHMGIYITDPAAVRMITRIRPRMKNLFIKTLLRNSLTQLMIPAFITDRSLDGLYDVDAAVKHGEQNGARISLSSFKKEERKLDLSGYESVIPKEPRKRKAKKEQAPARPRGKWPEARPEGVISAGPGTGDAAGYAARMEQEASPVRTIAGAGPATAIPQEAPVTGDDDEDYLTESAYSMQKGGADDDTDSGDSSASDIMALFDSL